MKSICTKKMYLPETIDECSNMSCNDCILRSQYPDDYDSLCHYGWMLANVVWHEALFENGDNKLSPDQTEG